MDKKTMGQEKKEVDIMVTAVKLREKEDAYIKEMDKYIADLKNQSSKSKDIAEQEAKDALIRTGVMSKNGKMKKKIVSWE